MPMKRTFTPDWRLERENTVSESGNQLEKVGDSVIAFSASGEAMVSTVTEVTPDGRVVTLGGPFDVYAQQRVMPLPDAHPSQWQVFLDYQLAQPQSRESMGRLALLRDALKRWALMAEDFSGYWARAARDGGE